VLFALGMEVLGAAARKEVPMAEQIGVIIENSPDGLSRVYTTRQRTRGGCYPNTQCSPLESRAFNAIGAGEGDVVKLSLPQGGLFEGVALIYVLPIAALLAGALVGFWLGNLWGWPNAGSVLAAIGGLGAGLWAVRRLGRRRSLLRKVTPVITEIFKPAGKPPKPSQGTCCG
jgi:positive regulator of sigma E activity